MKMKLCYKSAGMPASRYNFLKALEEFIKEQGYKVVSSSYSHKKKQRVLKLKWKS